MFSFKIILLAGFWCGTLEEFVSPNWDDLLLNDALQAYSISDSSTS